ncbi:MAG: hypothetical protein DWI22_10900 [Planctomycetota bacterium]|nr:MAG: hypothetical protein DWI22_10900 [Planctomycetota bacterium]
MISAPKVVRTKWDRSQTFTKTITSDPECFYNMRLFDGRSEEFGVFKFSVWKAAVWQQHGCFGS